ncbi:hypothetical protein BDV96DRAFT_642648 [Lophiotrema nucula]|uniref:Uncharacterized protein n=1 Tax=Lophiotrema nucula TaxID=690887 RepID=A0A6A5ZJ97_9PLEO|nr:hypothetical protein BDV96DRAFT_642648 [Lophiotrema nucula]
MPAMTRAAHRKHTSTVEVRAGENLLLRLPPELRNYVYSYTREDTPTYTTLYDLRSGPAPTTQYLGLTGVCREICKECFLAVVHPDNVLGYTSQLGINLSKASTQTSDLVVELLPLVAFAFFASRFHFIFVPGRPRYFLDNYVDDWDVFNRQQGKENTSRYICEELNKILGILRSDLIDDEFNDDLLSDGEQMPPPSPFIPVEVFSDIQLCLPMMRNAGLVGTAIADTRQELPSIAF